MSGAGRSEAIHTFEDLGFFCIDNLPPSFIPQLVNLAELPGSRIRRLAVVCDVRAHGFFAELAGELKSLDDRSIDYHVLFLEADDDTLLRRFKETRRRHPLCDDGSSVIDGIRQEREALGEIRARADVIVDTTELVPRELRDQIRDRYFNESLATTLAITMVSFGFKYGLPKDADIIMDVRFLPNPYYNPDMRQLTGLDEPVREFVLGNAETEAFLSRWFPLLETVVPGYIMEGKHHLAIGVGCTGGMHRSVALAETTAAFLRDCGYRVAVSHRDIGRDREHR
ncbi:MAG: RNase adapter RapZ [Coriobacteriia bacterium]|nr:RNase adapter RapZ [Coriobacteriia bacterium]